MFQIVFKRLEPSELAKSITRERLSSTLARFPDLESARVVVTLAMENSPQQAGPDLFCAKLRIKGSRYDGVILERRSENLYVALAELDEHLLERLSRFGDRQRARGRRPARSSQPAPSNKRLQGGTL